MGIGGKMAWGFFKNFFRAIKKMGDSELGDLGEVKYKNLLQPAIQSINSLQLTDENVYVKVVVDS